MYRQIRLGNDFPWDHYQQSARSIDKGHPTLARETNGIDPVDPTFSISLSEPQRSALSKLSCELRLRDYAIRTEQTYCHWVERFFLENASCNVNELDKTHVKSFLSNLVLRRNVSKSTQNVALTALAFFYKEILCRQLPEIDHLRSRRKPKLPVVLTQSELKRLFDEMSGIYLVMAKLMYGTGMRIIECIRLRVKDVDFSYQIILISNAKGGKSRRVPLPNQSIDSIRQQIDSVFALHDADLAIGAGEVFLPNALARKYPNATTEKAWQYIFPSSRLSVDPRSGVTRRHHQHETSLQRAIKSAATKAGINKQVSSHCLSCLLYTSPSPRD